MNKKRLAVDAATAVLVIAALSVAAVTVRRELTRPPPPLPAVSLEKDWESYANAGHVIGRDDAPVTIVEFSDFQCPYCAQFAKSSDSLRALGENVKVVYRYLPARAHVAAIPAIRASECAAAEGKFGAMHAALFKYPDSLGVVYWWWFAKTAGLQDSVRFNGCMKETGPIAALVADTAAARRLHATGTPTLLIQEIRPRGLPSFDSLRAYIHRVKPKSVRPN